MLKRKTGEWGKMKPKQKPLTKTTHQTKTLYMQLSHNYASLSSLFKPKFSKLLNFEIYFPHWYSNCCFWVDVGVEVVVTDRQLSTGERL